MKFPDFFRSVSAAALLAGAVACAKPSEAPKAVAAAPAVKMTAAALPVLGPAPMWSLKDVNGAVVTSAQFEGKVVVVDFWATWCGPCREEMPGYTDLQKKYGKDGLVIVGISRDEGGPGVVKAFIDKFGVGYQIVMGEDSAYEAFGGMDAIPTTFLIDRTGQVRDRKVGVEPTEEYEKKIVALLN